MQIDIIAGARPNFVKIAPIVKELDLRENKNKSLSYRIIHTGQHYDEIMSNVFFSDLGIPKPSINLSVGSGSHAEQTGAIMSGYERVLEGESVDICLVVGDVNSTLACSIVAKKSGLKVGHVEAGIRSGDWSMPEEINRVVTDSITDYFYTTSQQATTNLMNSGVSKDSICFAGNTMIDSLLSNRSRFKKPDCWDEYKLEDKNYLVLTMHRPGNVDDADSLVEKISVIASEASNKIIVFPVHPRTANVLSERGLKADNLIMIEPLGYLEFNYLVDHSFGVITDSGGISEETTVMRIPCITLRDNTERPETVSIGTNEVVGTSISAIKEYVPRIAAGDWKKGGIPELWDGKAAERIVDHLMTLP